MLASIFWIFGYLNSKFGTSSDGEYLIVPRWIYVIVCGNPKSDELPKNALVNTGLRSQIIGWSLVIYGVFIRSFIPDRLLSFLVGFVGSGLLSLLVSSQIAQR